MNRALKSTLSILVIFVLGLISGHITIKILSSGDMVTVPDLKGKSIEEAKDILQGMELQIKLIGKDYDPNIPEQCIISQDVPANSMIKKGSQINVITSLGHPVEDIPDIIGLPVDFAEAMLKERGIVIKKFIYVHSERVEKNIVLAQRPEPGEKKGEGINILVSLGNYEK